MYKILKLLKRIIRRLIAVAPTSLLRYLDDVVHEILGKGLWQTEVSNEVTVALSLLPKTKQKHLNVVDIGANKGDWTDSIIKIVQDCTVVCFEPSRYAYECARLRFQSENRVTVLNLGISNSERLSTLFSPERGSTMSSLTPRRILEPNTLFNVQESVSLTTLDQWCEKNSFFPDLIKIDVEGHELSVIQGATRVLKQTQVVQFEFGGTHIENRTFIRDFYEFFRQLDFRLYRLSLKGVLALNAYTEKDECFRFSTFFAVKVDK